MRRCDSVVDSITYDAFSGCQFSTSLFGLVCLHSGHDAASIDFVHDRVASLTSVMSVENNSMTESC